MRILIRLTVVAALVNLVAFGLTDLDEGFYASVAWEMHQRGDWLTPTFGGEPWFEKPPFLYWLMGLSQSVFGENQFAIRLPSTVMFLLTLIMLGYWGNRRLGDGTGTRSALLFALAPLSFLLAHLAITDMTLTALLLFAIVALWESAERPVRWSLLGGLALGGATLTKGPVGLVLVGLLYLWNARLLHSRGLKFRWVVVALGVALLTCLPWYVGVYLKHGGDFFNEFVVRQNLLRFAGGDTAHSTLALMTAGGIGNFFAGLAIYLLFYGVVLALGAIPMVGGVKAVWSGDPDPLRTYLRRWALLVFGLFTLSFTKLPAYIFPMFPALALLVADWLTHNPVPRWGRNLVMGASVIWLVAGSVVAWMSGAYWAIGLGAGYLLLSAGLLGLPQRQPTKESAAVLSLSRTQLNLLLLGGLLLLVGFNGALVGYDRLALRPVRELALSVPAYRTLIAYRVNPSYPSLLFYRKGRYASSRDAQATLEQMRTQGAYCLTTSAEFARNPAVLVVRQRTVLGREFFLLAPRYDQPL